MRTELARVQTDAQKRSFEKNGFELYRFHVNAGCCHICAEVVNTDVGYGKGTYRLDKLMPGVNAAPMHPFCRCAISPYEDSEEYEAWLEYLEKGGATKRWNEAKLLDTKKIITKSIKNNKNSDVMKQKEFMKLNLQFFAMDNKESVLKKISKNESDKNEFEECYNRFRVAFKNGIKTPISTVYDNNDRFYHIIDRYEYMMSPYNVDRIVSTLQKPCSIYKTRDKFGLEANCYIENINKNPLLVIERRGIITAYIADKEYLQKIIGKGELLWQKR